VSVNTITPCRIAQIAPHKARHDTAIQATTIAESALEHVRAF
jgi:hypothetical protein